MVKCFSVDQHEFYGGLEMANGYMNNMSMMSEPPPMDYTSEYSPNSVVIGQPDGPAESFEKLRNDAMNELYQGAVI